MYLMHDHHLYICKQINFGHFTMRVSHVHKNNQRRKPITPRALIFEVIDRRNKNEEEAIPVDNDLKICDQKSSGNMFLYMN